jgi:hypothetical protein
MADAPNDKLAKLKQQRARYDEKIKRLEKAEREKERKRDTRRKILAGAVVLTAIENEPDKKAWFARLLDQELIRDDDRELFDLPAKDASEKR